MEDLSHNTIYSNYTKHEIIISMFSPVSVDQCYEYYIISLLCVARIYEHSPLEPSPTYSKLCQIMQIMQTNCQIFHEKLHNLLGSRPIDYMSRAT